MKKYLVILGAAALIGAGCGDNGGNHDGGMDMGVQDFGGVDMGGGAIGSTCVANSDCHEGPSPVCFAKNLFNSTQYVKTPGGYCSSTCTADSDCGSSGSCIDFGAQGKYCFNNCMAPTDCRSGYACWFGNPSDSCFPSANLSCDPTKNDAACVTPTGPGACIRAALGMGNRGICYDTCLVGSGTCPNDPNSGAARHCIVDDETKDSTGAATGDLWKGPICFDQVTNPGPDADGAECTYPDGMGGMTHFIDVCIDGDECDVQNTTTRPSGDNKCHELCYLTGGGPNAPDGGTSPESPDGGMPEMTCATGTCMDVYGLANDPTPWKRVGLCE